jgi:tetratricopeptide (TPR) repeat protein
MNDLIRNGGTFSGHERNCAYLNIRDGTFANISAVSGLDFLDDARSHALVDWDHDGDLDVWTANRTAPQMRLMRNDAPPRDHHFLAIRLEGSRSNRDAIGARVELVLSESPDQKIVKSLRAGEGFLGQSTKWLQFGLGNQTKIDRLLVNWPGDRQPDVFTEVQSDQFYYLKQDDDRLETVTFSSQINLSPSEVPAPTSAGAQRVLLTSRVLMPSLDYQTFDGQTESLDQFLGAPLLVNLWAAWCEPCLAELSSLAHEESRLSSAGLQVVALSVDDADADRDTTSADARAAVGRIGFPFRIGIASPKLLEILNYLSDLRFSEHRSMPLPSNLLVDQQGRVAAIYRGAFDIDQLLSDVSKLALPEAEWQNGALPFAGRWHRFPDAPSPMVVPLHMMREGHIAEALGCVNRFGLLLAERKEYPRLLVWLGDELFRSGQISDGLRQYERALQCDPDYLPAMNNLAWKYATFRDARVRDGAKGIFWAERAAHATNFSSAAVLDTLAAAYAEAGRWSDAVETARKALELARAQPQNDLAESIQNNVRQYEQRQPLRTDGF